MNPFKIALAASTALVASTSLSRATTILTQVVTASYSGSTNWGPTTSTSSSFTPTKALSVAGFSASGTLQSVTVTVQDIVNGSVNLKNNGTSATNVSGNLINFMNFVVPVAGTKKLVATSAVYSDTSLAAGDSSGYQPVSGSTSYSKSYTAGLATFESAWTVTAGDYGQVAVSAGNGNGSATYTDIGKILITVDYNYTTPTPTPTPEPATMAVLGSGLAGLGLLRRRRK